MSNAGAGSFYGLSRRGRAGALAGMVGLGALSIPAAEAGPIAMPPVQTAGCVGAACAAPVILVQDGGLIGRMREWRGSERVAPRRVIRQRASFERRQARRSRPAAERRRPRAPEGPVYAHGGTYTTMCVRSCDGYFFPISFSTTEDRFDADQQACQARCPGMEVSLYVHKVMGETSDQMRSISGTPYTDLTNAFLYKLKGPSQDPETCGCRIPTPVLQAVPAYLEEEPKAGPPELWTIPVPRWRPDPNAPAAIETATLEDAPKKTIRVVGPAFFPDQ